MQKPPDDQDTSQFLLYGEYTDAEELSLYHNDMTAADIPCIEQIAGSSENPNLPVMVLDSDLMIVRVTESVSRLFSKHHDNLYKPFFNVF